MVSIIERSLTEERADIEPEFENTSQLLDCIEVEKNSDESRRSNKLYKKYEKIVNFLVDSLEGGKGEMCARSISKGIDEDYKYSLTAVRKMEEDDFIYRIRPKSMPDVDIFLYGVNSEEYLERVTEKGYCPDAENHDMKLTQGI